MEQPHLGNIAFNGFLQEGKLMGSRCHSCGTISVPPRPMCNECFGNEMEWTELKGKGRLEAFTCTAVGPPFMAEKGYSAQNPYCVGVVKLEEGAQVVALIDGVDSSQPESIRSGLPLEVSFVEGGEDASGGAFLVFRPA
ncbi:MAG: Zn-ribbon domain-containing OB-fold protein [Dehalococcoidia bacterium]